jgi:hypothetical protein
VFHCAPVFKNELINRERLTGAITVARKNFFTALINSWDRKDFDFPSDKFPPEKMIYTTLLKNTKMHKNSGESSTLNSPGKNNSFYHVWKAGEDFLTDAKSRKKSLNELYEILQNKPFGLKWGFLEFWVPTVLFIKRNDYALFIEDKYIPFLNEDIFELLIKIPKKVEVKSFNVEGVKLDLFNKYRQFIKADETAINNESFVETIKPFFVFYKKLPEYSRNTKRLNTHAIKLREAIANSKDPEDTFFNEFPQALGYVDLNNSDEKFIKEYVEKLQEGINEIKSSYDELLSEVEKVIIESFGEKKTDLKKLIDKARVKYTYLSEYKLTSKQKSFISRVTNDLIDREKWISSLVQILINKTLDNISDEELYLLIERIKSAFSELEDLYEISKETNSQELANISKITISSFGREPLSRVISNS